MNSTNFMIVLVVLLVIIYIYGMNIDNFDPNLSKSTQSAQSSQTVNYNTKKQNCDELTYNPNKCYIETVVPSNTNVCVTDTLVPITNNQKEYKKNKKETIKRPSVKLQYDFDLLSSFNDSQIDNLPSINNFADNKNTYELETDVKSLNSLENDLMSNY